MKKLVVIWLGISIFWVVRPMNHGSLLVDAIQNSDLTAAQTILQESSINPHKKIGTRSPLEEAYQTALNNPDNARAQEIKKIIVETSLTFENLYQIRDRLRSDIIPFANTMNVYANNIGLVVKQLFLFCADNNGFAKSIGQLIAHQWNPTLPADLLKNEGSVLVNLIWRYPAEEHDGATTSSHASWVLWCIKHGAPLNVVSENTTPLLAAVMHDLPDVVRILVQHGADRKQSCTIHGNQETPLTWLAKISELSNSDANQQIKQLLEQAGNGGTNVSTHLRTYLTSYKAWIALVVCYLGVKCYQRLNKKQAHYAQHMIINATESEITIIDADKQAIRIEAGAHKIIDLSKTSNLRIVCGDGQELKIDLDRYEQETEESFMNITIRPIRWYEWCYVKTPLTYSVAWRRKSLQ